MSDHLQRECLEIKRAGREWSPNPLPARLLPVTLTLERLSGYFTGFFGATGTLVNFAV